MTQKYLKNTGLIALISILSMIPPLSTDLYMPALPEMKEFFHTTSTLTSFTMTIFFIFMAVGMLILGPLSDKYGRRPILLLSVVISLVFSVACAYSPTIGFLLVMRAWQAFGAGGMVTIATALIKDSFAGKSMTRILSITQALAMLAPMFAPILGAFILQYSDWKMTFIALALLTVISLIGAILLQETLPKEKRTAESTWKSILGLTRVAKNKTFIGLLLVGGLLTAPYMAYLGVASYIYIVGFGISETAFSMYFAFTSAFAVLGPLLYMRLGVGSVKTVFNSGFIIVAISVLLLLFIGDLSPIVFLLCFIPFTLLSTYFRPMISDLLLSAQKNDVGAASSVMNFGFTVIGSVGMIIGSLRWGSYIDGLGYTMLMFGVLALLVWMMVFKAGKSLDTGGREV